MEKIFSFFYAFLGSKRIEQMRRWAVQKAQDTALEAADPKKGRTPCRIGFRQRISDATTPKTATSSFKQ